MVAAVAKRGTGGPRKRPRRQKFDRKKMGDIALRLEHLAGRVRSIQDKMQESGVAYLEFDGASAVERGDKDLSEWIRLASFDLITKRGDEFPDLN